MAIAGRYVGYNEEFTSVEPGLLQIPAEAEIVQPLQVDEPLILEDPSEYRPEYDWDAPVAPDFAKKDATKFRNYYGNNVNPERVKRTYKLMHTNQTHDFAKGRLEYWTRFDKARMGILPALELLNNLVDESDPDVDLPNICHAFQTAERIREQHPHDDWFHLVGLIHDLGKVMALWGEDQYAVVGDTFVVGCRPAEGIVFREDTFDENPDLHHPVFSTPFGIYQPRCGLENVTMSWGHDEYMYRVLKHNKTTLPDEGLYAIRFHSFYPWHTCKDYLHLCNKKDMDMLKWVQEFNKFDLYSKGDALPDIEALKPYYQSLIDKYIPGVLEW